MRRRCIPVTPPKPRSMVTRSTRLLSTAHRPLVHRSAGPAPAPTTADWPRRGQPAPLRVVVDGPRPRSCSTCRVSTSLLSTGQGTHARAERCAARPAAARSRTACGRSVAAECCPQSALLSRACAAAACSAPQYNRVYVYTGHHTTSARQNWQLLGS
jgi:hypothetical protein